MPDQRLARLLQLYPVEVLREGWGVAGTKAEIAERIAREVSEEKIADFCRVSHERTKQRVVLLESAANDIKSFGDPLLSGNAPVFIRRTNQRLEEFYLLEVSYTAVVGPPYAEKSVDFLWPVHIVAGARTVWLTFTIMEKNIGTYLGQDVNAYGVKKDLDEDGVISLLASRLDDPSLLKRADINKGVKKLWSDGVIDAAHSKWKASKATVTETMDEKCYLRKDDQGAYDRAMKAPLLKTVFHTMDTTKKFPAIFTVVPCEGEVAVTRYPENANEVATVVAAILSGN